MQPLQRCSLKLFEIEQAENRVLVFVHDFPSAAAEIVLFQGLRLQLDGDHRLAVPPHLLPSPLQLVITQAFSRAGLFPIVKLIRAVLGRVCKFLPSLRFLRCNKNYIK